MMKIRYLKHIEIDIGKWDNCITQSINGIVYGYSWYLDIVCPDWDALVYNDYESVMPLTQNRKYGINYLFQPFFTQQLGIFSSNKIDKSLILTFLSLIPSKFKFIEINLNKYNYVEVVEDFEIRKNTTYELDLIHNYENIFRKYKKNNIRNIRKAIENKISIIKGLSPDEIFGLVQSSGTFPGLKKKGFDILHKLIRVAINQKTGYLYGAYNTRNILCAAGFFVYANQKACFILSVSNNEGKAQSAMFLLVDEFIKDFSGQNMILDFEGSNIEGIARFYKGFGATAFNYPTIIMNKLPYPLKLLKN